MDIHFVFILMFIFLASYIAVWLFFAIYGGIKHELFQVFGYIFMLTSFAFSSTLLYAPYPTYFTYISLTFASLALLMIFFGLIHLKKRWIKRRGTERLNDFSYLGIYAYVRHPITLGMILITISTFFLLNSLLSNITAAMAFLSFLLSSVEKDNYLEENYGYPYKTYASKVPRFNIITGILKSQLSDKVA